MWTLNQNGFDTQPTQGRRLVIAAILFYIYCWKLGSQNTEYLSLDVHLAHRSTSIIHSYLEILRNTF